MSKITYHRATVEDVHILVENRILFALELSGVQPQETIDRLKQQLTNYFAKATADSSCISFIAKRDGEVAGIGTVHVREMPANFKNPSGKWGYIMNMFTLPVHRRKGICKGILNALVEEGAQYGLGGYELHATHDGELVYKQEGFVIHNEPTYRKFIRK